MDKNTLNDSRIIANFLISTGKYRNYILKSEYSQNIYFQKRVEKINSWVTQCSNERFLFHKNWHWLMSVVEECLKIDFDNRLHEELKHTLVKVDIEQTFDACVEFIKWKNSQKLPLIK